MLKKKQPAAKSLKIRSLAEDSGYRGHHNKFHELSEKRRILNEEESNILHRLNYSNPEDSPVKSSVLALLGEAAPSEHPAPEGFHKRLTDVQRERRDVESALEIVQQRMTKARREASKTICADIEGEYRARVKALGDTLVAAWRANAALNEITEALIQNDIAWVGRLRPLGANRIVGDPFDAHGRVPMWLKEAHEYGYFEKTSIEDLKND